VGIMFKRAENNDITDNRDYAMPKPGLRGGKGGTVTGPIVFWGPFLSPKYIF